MASIGASSRLPAIDRPTPAASQPAAALAFSRSNGQTRPKSRPSEPWPLRFDTKISAQDRAEVLQDDRGEVVPDRLIGGVGARLAEGEGEEREQDARQPGQRDVGQTPAHPARRRGAQIRGSRRVMLRLRASNSGSARPYHVVPTTRGDPPLEEQP